MVEHEYVMVAYFKEKEVAVEHIFLLVEKN